MSKRAIHGITVTTNNEHEDKEGYSRCNECDTKTMLVMAPSTFAVMEEAFKADETNPEGTPDEVFVGEVTGHWCPKCNMLVSLSYNFPC